jgi:hypothetical protein
MRKPLSMKDLAGRYGLAVSLVILLTAIACSTYTHDAVQTNAPAPAVLRGASLTTAPPVNSQGPASMTTPSTEALAIMAANQGYNGKFLGYIEGSGPTPSSNYTAPVGRLIAPSVYANPASTSSAPIPVIIGVEDAGIIFGGGATGTPVAVNGASATTAATTTGVATTAATTAALTAAANLAATAGTVTAAPTFTTAATVATPTNTANVLTPGQFAAGPGAASTPAPIVNSGPLPVAPGTVLANGNTGTLTPTISSAALVSPTVASNPPVTLANANQPTTTMTVAPMTAPAVASARGAIAPIVVSSGTASGVVDLNARAAAANAPITSTSNLTTITNLNGGLRVTAGSASTSSSATTSGGGNIAPINFSALTASGMTSSSTIGNSTMTAPVTVAPIMNESTARRRAVQAPASGTTEPVMQPATNATARRRAVQAPSSGTTEPVMQSGLGRLRAVRAPSNVPPRQHAIRVTTAPDGTAVITNNDGATFSQRVQQSNRDQQNPQQ